MSAEPDLRRHVRFEVLEQSLPQVRTIDVNTYPETVPVQRQDTLEELSIEAKRDGAMYIFMIPPEWSDSKIKPIGMFTGPPLRLYKIRIAQQLPPIIGSS